MLRKNLQIESTGIAEATATYYHLVEKGIIKSEQAKNCRLLTSKTTPKNSREILIINREFKPLYASNEKLLKISKDTSFRSTILNNPTGNSSYTHSGNNCLIGWTTYKPQR